MLRKKVSPASTVAVLLIGIVSGCASERVAPATIRVIGESVPTVDAISDMAKEYERLTGVRVEVEQYEFETALQKATLDLTSGTGIYDVVLQYPIALGRFATQKHLYALDELVAMPQADEVTFQAEDYFFSSYWRELSWYEGKAYGYPLAANTMFVWYRKDLLANLNEAKRFENIYGYKPEAPQTWEQYRDLAEFFNRPSEGFYGTLLQARQHPAIWYEWLNLAFSFGGGVFNKDNGWSYGPVILDSPATIQATEFYRSLLAFSPPGSTNFTWDDALAEMQQGRVFECIMWSDAVFAVEDPKQSQVAGKVGYTPIPAGPGGRVAHISGFSSFISRYSKAPAQAFNFVLWLLKEENQVKQQLNGGSSAVRSVYDVPAVARLPYAAALGDSFSVGRYMTDSFPEAEEVSDELQVALSSIVSGMGAPQDVLSASADVLERRLAAKTHAGAQR